MFEVAIQAASAADRARETVRRYGKNVLAKCYGCDSSESVTPEKQKEGKKRMSASVASKSAGAFCVGSGYGTTVIHEETSSRVLRVADIAVALALGAHLVFQAFKIRPLWRPSADWWSPVVKECSRELPPDAPSCASRHTAATSSSSSTKDRRGILSRGHRPAGDQLELKRKKISSTDALDEPYLHFLKDLSPEKLWRSSLERGVVPSPCGRPVFMMGETATIRGQPLWGFMPDT